ncbi:hypothetical protein [Nostoc sp.]|uniref:hypothetical protein n=1 Tax=Nostoc sp. TaxID=1180 RepID=UPI002FF95E57
MQDKNFLTTRDIYLVIKFLCQTNFKNKNKVLFKKLKYNDSFRHIASVYEESKIVSDAPGYYQLSATQINILMGQPHIIEQIRLRVFNEKIGSYSVALNHLLNEIHGICMLIDKNNTNKNKDYNAEHAVKYLAFTGVPHDICIDTRNLFDRRNRNTVSHPGSEQNIAWGVTKDEYTKYRNAVGQCLKIVLCSP